MTRFLRKLNNLFAAHGTWNAVALHLGVDPRTLRKWWSGECKPSPENIRKVLR